jgi:hypothetical protein
MSLSNIELYQILAMTGVGKIPITGGPAGSLKSTISQTIPLEGATASLVLSTGVMSLCSIYIPTNTTVSNINAITSSTAESAGSHFWFALYDDGRGSSTAGQLALLGQTADQTGATFAAANTNIGLSLITPYSTTYSGIYYIAVMCVGTTPTFLASTKFTATFTIAASAGAFCGSTAGSGLTNQAPNPSGVTTSIASMFYGYIS